jgi:biopolymer transport protein ExbB
MMGSVRGRPTLLSWFSLRLAATLMAACLFAALPAWQRARGQDEPAASTPAGPSGEPAPAPAVPAAPARAAAAALPAAEPLSIFKLAIAGGIFMIPIAGMSILAVTMTFERLLGLRTRRVLPDGLADQLSQLAAAPGNFDPRKLFRTCQQHPSAAASVVRAMLGRIGRPLPEIESAIAQTSQREADKLYANVRWLNLAASLSTLLGLIGTIQGMILAFHRLTTMDAAADRTHLLADGIYTALVTTFAGLAVAIPAMLASHYFESRILSKFHQIDELTLNLLPQLERYEGHGSLSRQSATAESPLEEESGHVEAGAT